MVVRLLNKIQNGDGEFPAGSVLEIDDSEAKRLLKLKAAKCMEDDLDDEEIESEDQTKKPEVLIGLKEIPGIKDEVIEALTGEGIYSVQELAEKDPEDLVIIKGIGAKTAERLIDAANEILDNREESDEDDGLLE